MKDPREARLPAEFERFLKSWTNPSLGEAGCRDFIERTRLLAAAPLARFSLGQWRSGLCSDGTPIELSMALSSCGKGAFRLACDITDPHQPRHVQIREYQEVGARLLPSKQTSAREMLAYLFEKHLHEAPASSRFLVWHGIGMGSGEPSVGKVYFNTSWLRSSEVLSICSPLLPADALQTLLSSRLLQECGVACAGYDFTDKGLTKVKLYARLQSLPLEAIVNEAKIFHVPGIAQLCEMVRTIARSNPSNQHGSAGFGVGFVLQSNMWEIKAAVNAEEWGWHSMVECFQELAPILCGYLVSDTNTERTSGDGVPETKIRLSPTIVSVGVSGDRHGVAVYFRPIMPVIHQLSLRK